MQNNQSMDACVLLYNNNSNHQNHEDNSAGTSIQPYIQFAREVGYPKKPFSGEGSQLLSGCDSMKISFADLKGQFHSRMKEEYKVCSGAAHHIHGKVERKICQIKDTTEENFENQSFSVL